MVWSCHAIVRWIFNVQKNGVYTGNCEKVWMCVDQISESTYYFVLLSESIPILSLLSESLLCSNVIV